MDIYGVIGWPIKHSLSPAMHNAAFKELGMQYKAKYIKIPVDPDILEDFLLKDIEVKDAEGNPVRSKEILGFNITVPHKIRAREILEKKYKTPIQHVQSNVILTGAVNTVKRTADILDYWNTDVLGFQTALKEDLKFDTENKIVLLIGCGGAGRAIIAALSNIGVNKIYIYEINKIQIDSTKEYFSKLSQNWKDILKKKVEYISLEQLPEKIKECQLLVNASPMGMTEGYPRVIDKKLLHKGLFIYDVIYNRETELIKDAKSLGLRCSGGMDMLLYQGAHAFKFWTGVEAPIKVMRKALESAIEINK